MVWKEALRIYNLLSDRKGRTARMMFGMLPSSEMTCNRSTASLLPTMSLTYTGRYFSTCSRESLASANWHSHFPFEAGMLQSLRW